MEKKFAVVILNWNGVALLRQFLPSVIKYSSEANIYIIDNASTDESIAVIQKEFPSVKLIKNMDNGGYAKGYNQGLKNINEPYLVLLNSDIEVTEHWLAPIGRIFEVEPQTAVVQPKILDYKKKDFFEYAGAAGGFLDKYGFPYCRGRVFDTIERDSGQYNDEIEIFWASGACLFIRNEVFKKFGGFDEAFFAHQEEIDLCWRVQNGGYVIKYCGFSTVYHVGGATLSYSNPKKTYLNFRNSLLMMYKNLPRKKSFSIIFQRLCLDGVAGIWYILCMQPKHCWAIIRSHFGFYRRIPQFRSKRLFNSNEQYYRTNSIVWKYFVRKERFFH
ncbi:glycosyltransferase family 2 protein [Myroides pelagicus]|uniref:Glycosyltransferase n=1 Tax=Myroides pelagicus TaxID=270914 RepID=A0A7K1GJU0_9FLAO|nr:glycosyltransferase family 2 protein [Myroides pelagicus]MEC4113907.1 glycosyltransferase family 2 protein [Myroides pelagicus]MTH29141.1 glycosyltransferase [Myroides pelagicus]